jgi:hypothetical protein
MKARMARPNGHHQIKLRIIRTIQAGFPNSSSFVAIGMADMADLGCECK